MFVRNTVNRPCAKKGAIALGSAALAATMLFGAPLATAAEITNTTIYVPGTKPITGSHDVDPKNLFGGLFGPRPGTATIEVDYPRSFGPFTGAGDPGYNESRDLAKAGTRAAILQALDENPGKPVYVVTISQGSDAATKAVRELEEQGVDGMENVVLVAAGNPLAANGGILTRLPFGVYVPILGVTFGGQQATGPTQGDVLQVTKQYDGFAHFPKYVWNVVSIANAIVGAGMYHGDYENVDIFAEDVIVSTTPDGKVTDFFIPTKEVPLVTLLVKLGLPQPIADIINPIMKAVVDIGYGPQPEGDGAYPAKAVRFGIFPSLSEIGWMAGTLADGVKESFEVLGDKLSPQPATGTDPEPEPNMLAMARVSDSTEETPQPEFVPVNEESPAEAPQPQPEPEVIADPEPEPEPEPEPKRNVVRNSLNASEPQGADESENDDKDDAKDDDDDDSRKRSSLSGSGVSATTARSHQNDDDSGRKVGATGGNAGGNDSKGGGNDSGNGGDGGDS